MPVRVLVPSQGDAGRAVDGYVRTVSVRNCSIRFPSAKDIEGFVVGQVCAATLALEGVAVPLTVEVARVVAANEVAVKFKPPFPRELKSLEKFLEPRFLGQSMREIDPSQLQQHEGNHLRWFQGANDTGLFSWTDPKSGTVVHQQILFLTRVVEWGTEIGLRTGRVRQEVFSPGRGWMSSELLEFDAIPDPELLHQVRVLVRSAKIDENVKKVFLGKI